MSKDKILAYLPYALLIVANIIYIFANGLKPIRINSKQFVFNILFFVIVGIVIMIKINLLLHCWFVKEEGDVKSKTKIAIKKILDFVQFGFSIFRKGNEKMMIKVIFCFKQIFFYLNVWIFVSNYIPSFLLGVMVGTYFQYKGMIETKFQQQFKRLDDMRDKIIVCVLEKLPKYLSRSSKLQ